MTGVSLAFLTREARAQVTEAQLGQRWEKFLADLKLVGIDETTPGVTSSAYRVCWSVDFHDGWIYITVALNPRDLLGDAYLVSVNTTLVRDTATPAEVDGSTLHTDIRQGILLAAGQAQERLTRASDRLHLLAGRYELKTGSSPETTSESPSNTGGTQ